MKRSRLRPQAELDLIAMSTWYAERCGPALAARFLDAARAALTAVEQTPGIGSLRLGHIAGREGLRSWPATPFPARWLYFERDDHLDVVRLLGERQDIATILQDECL